MITTKYIIMKNELRDGRDSHLIPMTSVAAGTGHEVAPDVYYYTNQIVNVIFFGKPNEKWVLIDAGVPQSAHNIIAAAEKRFGKGAKPEYIVLTHGHFDHVGSLVALLEKWGDIPVYAHPYEFPYLTGKEKYPEPDSTVEGAGLLAKMTFAYPEDSIDITPVLNELPHDNSIPGMPGWQWVHTPGHSPGHTSFFREQDSLLIAGDAFITVQQDSLYKVLVQKQELHGPPVYFTTNWTDARQSVRKLNNLEPEIAITGHGHYMHGEKLKEDLNKLAMNFDELALPEYGKYVKESDKEK